MSTTRREFLKRLGIALAALAATRCALPLGRQGDEWDNLREQWINLDRLAKDARDYPRGEESRDRLVANHRAALDKLVQAGKLDAAVAGDVQAAFEGAAYHVWRANAPITCYEPMLGPDYQVQSSSDLAKQADILVDLARQGATGEATISQAQLAIERDIAYLSLSDEEQGAIQEAVIKAASGSYNFPTLAELELDISAESVQAAHILVDVLMGKK